jgi:hypothetical protein
VSMVGGAKTLAQRPKVASRVVVARRSSPWTPNVERFTPPRTNAGTCHTRFSEENQVLNYMYARIKFHTYSDIIVNNKNNIT